MKIFKQIYKYGLMAVITLMCLGSLTSCVDEQVPGNRYTFTGETIADFLEVNSEEFSSFITILKRANTWGELDTYGHYTCFAPTNDAIDAYLKQREMTSLDELTKEDCDTLSWTHLINSTFFMSDMTEGSLPSVNLLNRFLTLSYDSTMLEDGRYRLRHCINKTSHIIQLDDTVENGVVQVVDSVIKVAGDYVFDVLKENNDTKLFFEALNMVGLEDSLKKWRDETYSVSYDSVYEGVIGVGGGSEYKVYYWGEKVTNFTVLVEPDSVYAKHGINNIDDLIAYANEVYNDAYYPEHAGKYNPEDYRDRRHPLNKFVSYHILPFCVPSEANFNCRKDIIESRCITALIDPEDYFETLMPHSVMRVSTVTSGADKGVYINRRGIGTLTSSSTEFEGRADHRGVKIYTTTEMANVNSEACNGYIHYVDDILEYSDFVRNDILNRRMRIDCATLSPDFMTSGARQRKPSSGNEGIGFLQPTNFYSYNNDYTMWVRSSVTNNWSYQGDGVDLMGNYDIILKLPPIPFSGTWELRLSYRGYEGCGVVQNYVGDSPSTLVPCGIPTDLRLAANANPNIGWLSDTEDLEDDEELIKANDKSMKNRGYMKGPDSHTNGETAFRHLSTMARRIIVSQYFDAGKDYYLRMKLVLDNPMAEMNFDYMEWCPKSIYDNNEDRH